MSLSHPYFNVRHVGEGSCYLIDILWPDGEVEVVISKFASPELAARWVNAHRDIWADKRRLEIGPATKMSVVGS
jgi:hypothetical protein